MITYLDDAEGLSKGKRMAAMVTPHEGTPPAEVLERICEAARSARLIAWDLPEIPQLDLSTLEEVNGTAARHDALVVIVAAQPTLFRNLLYRKYTNLVVGG